MPSDKPTTTVSNLIELHIAEITEAWIEGIYGQSGGQTPELIDPSTLRNETTSLLAALSIAFTAEDYQDITAPQFAETIRLLEALSTSRAALGFTPSETATSVLSLKDALLKTIQAEFGNDSERLHEQVVMMNKVIDKLALVTFEVFTKVRENLILEQHLALEHSTPVVAIWDGMLLMPLMGIIDTQRAQQVIETLLDSIVSTESRVAILDLTGVPAFDTRVAQHIVKTVIAAKMLGADVIVTGISADAAQTLTKLGLDLGMLDTRGGLVAGVAAGFRRLGKEVHSVGE